MMAPRNSSHISSLLPAAAAVYVLFRILLRLRLLYMSYLKDRRVWLATLQG
jgi:hypothetical protein